MYVGFFVHNVCLTYDIYHTTILFHIVQMVHAECRPRSASCRSCYKLFRVLPCAVCKGQIAPGEDFAAEYVAAVPHRTPCCKADCHPECKESTDPHRCPICQCPLTKWEIDNDMTYVGDILAARRMEHINDIRRRDNLTYDVEPLYRPIDPLDPVW